MRLKGYLTVEASLVFPVILTIVMLMMGMSFYVYDRCIVKAAVYDALMIGAREELQGDVETAMEQKAEKLLKDNGVSLSDIDIKATKELLKVRLEIKAKVNLLWITSTDLPIHVKEELTVLDVIKVMRLESKAKKVLGER